MFFGVRHALGVDMIQQVFSGTCSLVTEPNTLCRRKLATEHKLYGILRGGINAKAHSCSIELRRGFG